MAFDGTCHCGAVAFTVEADTPTTAISCNCSHCRRKGFLLAFFPASSVKLARGSDALETYTFNTHRLSHRFCRTCGVQPFAEGKGPDGAETRAINLRCVPTVDLDALELTTFNGADI
jgi:hypothetical protein